MANIMIADDSDSIRMILKEILEIEKHVAIAEGKDGIETIEKFFKVKPDLLILDLSMPKKQGLEVIKEIISKDPMAKIIVLSGTDDKAMINQCLDLGAKGYISKPFEFETVLKTISNTLSL